MRRLAVIFDTHENLMKYIRINDNDFDVTNRFMYKHRSFFFITYNVFVQKQNVMCVRAAAAMVVHSSKRQQQQRRRWFSRSIAS